MDALFALSVILIWILICVVARFITTFIHELGHAVPALLFTHNAVFVFIGSYAEDKKNIFLRFGRLHLYFHFNILKLYSGLCAYEGKISHKQQLIITLSGPFMSLVSALALIFAIHTQSYSDTIITFLAVFIFSFIYDFFINLIPREISGNMKSIRPIDNDGAKIRRLFAEMRLPFPYHEGMKLMARGEYSKASDIFAELISEGHHKRQVYSALIKNLVAEKRFNEALTVFEKYGSRFKLGALDYFTLSKIYFEKNLIEEAIQSIQKSIHLDYRNSMYLTFYGRCLIENFSFDKAIKKFNAAIFYNPNDIEGYLYRSLVFIKKGEMPSALHDLTIAKELNPENPILSLHYGFYYQAFGQKHDAIKHFEKAKNLGSEYHGLDYFIEELKAKVF